MPQIGHKVRVKYRNGQELVGTLVDIYTEALIYLHFVIKLESGETIDLCINDASEGVEKVEDLEM